MFGASYTSDGTTIAHGSVIWSAGMFVAMFWQVSLVALMLLWVL
jgi:hypothetical protein